MQFTAHQNRVSKDGEGFLLYLGYSAQAASNFRAAMLFHDIGKTYRLYEPKFWTLEDRPTKEQKSLQRRHARFGAQMWANYANDYEDLANHPHFIVRHAVTLYHHEREDTNGPEATNVTELPIFVQASCIVDAYDGDMIYRPHQSHKRTPREALERLQGVNDPKKKYTGAFDQELLEKYVTYKEQRLANIH